MVTLEKLGLAASEQTALREALDHKAGVIIVQSLASEARLGTLRVLQMHLENQRRDIHPFEPARSLFSLEMVEALAGDAFAAAPQRSRWPLSLELSAPWPVQLLAECPDALTLTEAFELAVQGHLVLATWQSGDGAMTLNSLIESGVDAQLLAEGLLAVLTQHTLPKVCPLCRVELAPSFEMEETFEQTFGALAFPFPGFSFRQGRGCATCNQRGTLGHVQVFEYLPMSPALADQIQSVHYAERLDSVAMSEGMLPWEAKLYFRIKHGDVSLDDAVAALKAGQAWGE